MKVGILLFLLAGSIVLSVIRWFRGGSFLPEPAPGEDRHVMDKDGRWWRETPDGVLEEVFRRAPNTPAVPKFLVKYAVNLAVLVGVALFFIAVAGDRIPEWAPWIADAACCFLFSLYASTRNAAIGTKE
jgi:hypothetical protein